jgi:hypothetical protein
MPNRAEGFEELPDPRDGNTVPSEIGQDHELEQIDWRVTALGEPACGRPLRGDGRCEEAAGVPPLELPGGQPGQGRHLARAVRVLQLHTPHRKWGHSTFRRKGTLFGEMLSVPIF